MLVQLLLLSFNLLDLFTPEARLTQETDCHYITFIQYINQHM